MKKELLKHLVSPLKKEEFKLITFKEEKVTYSDKSKGVEVVDGIILTKSKEWYPVIKGVPRILIGELKSQVLEQYPYFMKKYARDIKKKVRLSKTDSNRFDSVNKKTMSKFGFQWNHFDDMDSGLNYDTWMSNAVDHKKFFKNKLCLEVGSGAGGHAVKTLKYGAKLIATDLSHAIDVTYKKTKKFKNAYSIQCDLYRLPFKERYFEVVYCLGVLQHLPEPEKGFNQLNKYVKKSGSLFTNLYSNTRKVQLFIEDVIRFFIKPLPNPLILFFSYIFNFLDHLVFIWPFLFWEMINAKFMLKLYPSRTKIYSELGYRKSLDDWFDRLSAPIIIRYPREALINWYKKSKYKNIEVYDFNNSNWVGYGKLV